jgi:hypothetical protein
MAELAAVAVAKDEVVFPYEERTPAEHPKKEAKRVSWPEMNDPERLEVGARVADLNA